MTRWRIRYNIFSNAWHDSDEFFDNYKDADQFLIANGDVLTDAVVSWPDEGEE